MKDDKKFVWRAFLMVTILIAIFFIACFSSCTTVKTVTEYRDRVVHDTTQMVDSVYRDKIHMIYMEGDTTYIHDSVFLYKYKYLNHDVNVYIHDSIPYQVEVEKIVHQRSGYDKFCSWAFWIILILTIIGIVARILVKVYLHK